MFRHKIPIHLDQEDHFIAGLTARQILILGSGASIGYLLFNDFSVTSWSVIIGVLLGSAITLLGVAVAFFRWKGRGLEQWALVYVLFLASPKINLWRAVNNIETLELEQKTSKREEKKQREIDEW